MLRGNSGLMLDQPINAIYEQAIVNDGTPARASFSLQATQAGAPAFPDVLASGNAAANNPWIVDPDFQIARMWQNNLQLERGIGRHYSASVGVAYTRGDNLPVVSNINLLAPIGFAPGRASDLFHRHQRRHPAWTRASMRSSRRRRLANRLTKRSRMQFARRLLPRRAMGPGVHPGEE